ncbi:nuclear transcription factor Y subunit C-5-like [Dendrobium catenatum]|uniref:nuclear transcription factor Y subunit C-5-like n=1 Tax=Dendrobium catenatum TaxID=906689 RepID=UPI0010A0BE32|nr:nuclear transcription factor Y subunit C-5-like [Dendrobium catenatum]
MDRKGHKKPLPPQHAAAAKETPVICERACEMFIQELTEKAWAHAQKSNRQTIEKRDIVAAAKETGHCDFLVDRKRKNHRGAHGASSSTAIPGDPLDPPEPRYHDESNMFKGVPPLSSREFRPSHLVRHRVRRHRALSRAAHRPELVRRPEPTFRDPTSSGRAMPSISIALSLQSRTPVIPSSSAVDPGVHYRCFDFEP